MKCLIKIMVICQVLNWSCSNAVTTQNENKITGRNLDSDVTVINRQETDRFIKLLATNCDSLVKQNPDPCKLIDLVTDSGYWTCQPEAIWHLSKLTDYHYKTKCNYGTTGRGFDRDTAEYDLINLKKILDCH